MKLTHAALLLILVFPAISFAQQATNDQTQNRLEQERQNVIRQKEIDETQRIKKSLLLEKAKPQVKEEFKDNWCFGAKDIQLQGNKVFSVEMLSKKFLQKLPQCLNRADLEKIKSDIENFYIKKGYSNARVYFDNEALKKNILVIKIYEGIIKNIELNDNSKVDKYFTFCNQTKIFTAFIFPWPFLQNKVFNLRDFEQGMDQINRLQSSKAKMDVRPADEDGTSIIIVNNEIGDQTNFNLSYDNSGQKSTGKDKEKVSISQDNLLGLNDNIYLNYSQGSAAKDNEKYSKSFYSELSIPLGYWTLKPSYSSSEFLITSHLQNSTTKSSGFTEIQSYKLDRVLSRGFDYKIKLGGELDIKNTRSYQNDIRTENQSRKLVPVTFYLENVFYGKDSTLLIKPSYTKGTKLLNANQDPSGLPGSQDHFQYEYWKLYGYYNYNFQIPKTTIPLNYTLSFDSQFSKDTLYASEQFNIGGQYTVRGFADNSINGDNGYNVRNDLRVKILDLMPQKFLENKSINAVSDTLSKTFFTTFYDYGYIRNRYITGANSEGTMSGAGFKFNYVGSVIGWDLTYSRGIHSPQFIQSLFGQKKDSGAIYFNVSLAFGL